MKKKTPPSHVFNNLLNSHTKLSHLCGKFWGNRVCFRIFKNNTLVQNADAFSNSVDLALQLDQLVKTYDLVIQNRQDGREKNMKKKKNNFRQILTGKMKSAWKVNRDRKKKQQQPPSSENHITIIEMWGSSNYRNGCKTLHFLTNI